VLGLGTRSEPKLSVPDGWRVDGGPYCRKVTGKGEGRSDLRGGIYACAMDGVDGSSPARQRGPTFCIPSKPSA